MALGFWIWFGGTLANSLRERGEGRVAATIIGAVSAFAAIQLVSAGINGIAAHSVARAGEDGVTQALFNLTWGLDLVAAIPSAVFFLAASLGLKRTHMIPAWLSAAGIGVAALFILRSTNWATDGFWSPTGEYLFILIPLALLWILITSVVLVRSTPDDIDGATSHDADDVGIHTRRRDARLRVPPACHRLLPRDTSGTPDPHS